MQSQTSRQDADNNDKMGMGSVVYLSAKFRDAVVALCDEGSAKERLCTSFLKHLNDIHDEELPAGQRGLFVELRQRLHKSEAMHGESEVEASVRKMSGREAAACARSIVDLYTAAVVQDQQGHALHLVESEGESAGAPMVAVPEFLLKP